MPALIVMLRGVNVGGKVVPMDRLRDSFTGLGFKNVRTYIQSGNVVAGIARVAKDLSRKIEERISNEFGFPITAILRTESEMRNILTANPFLKERSIDVSRLHVTFLASEPKPEGIMTLRAIKAGSDRF